MNLSQCFEVPESLNSKVFNPFTNVASPDLQFVQEHFESLKTNCNYFSLPSANNNSPNPHSCKLNILHVNARSICSNDRFEEFLLFISRSACTWQAICVSESWLSDHLVSSRQIPGFIGYFNNRKERTGGGVALYINEHYVRNSNLADIDTLKCTESLFVEIQISSSLKCIIGVIYKPPDLNNNQFFDEFTNALEQLNNKNKTAFLVGDFNLDLFNISSDNASLEFFNILASYGFLPTIFKSTRISDGRWSLIDNIFCNNIELVTSSGIIYEDISDHLPIFVCCSLQLKARSSEVENKIFDKNKIENLKEYLTNELNNFSDITDPDEAAYRVLTAYTKGIEMFSYKVKYTRKNKNLKPWISSGILASINRRNYLFREKNKHPTSQNKTAYIRHRNCLNTVIREAKKAYFQQQLALNKNNSKKIWQLLRSCATGNSPKHELPNNFVNEDGIQLCDKNEVAAAFNEYFISVGEKLRNEISEGISNPLDHVATHNSSMLNDFEPTNHEELCSTINDMKNVGAGIDNINANIFKLTYTAITDQLVHLVNICLQNGVFPESMKVAIVKPVFKGGNKKIFTNYRPISILPYISKLVEKIIHKRIMTFLNDNNILSNNQFGFQKSLSTFMPILLLQETITKAFENGNIAAALFIDLKKAFDTVDHDILIGKCSRYGITGSALQLLQSYLTKRQQCVEFKDVRSPTGIVNVGVPQGSILGPLLFLIYINDLPNICKKSKCLLYADDTALIFESSNASELQNSLNQELPAICQWLQENKLSLNTRKTVYQIYSNSNTPVHIEVKLNGDLIQTAEKVKYLGMIIDPHLKWDYHIDHLAVTISRNIGIMNRAKFFLNENHLTLLYNALILPYINYCCLIWGFTFPTYLHKLELLQKRAVRIIVKQHRLAHTDPIFQHLKILKVKDIAKQQLIILLHRKINNRVPPQLDSMFIAFNHTDTRTRSRQHFSEPFTAKLYRTRVATWIGPRIWNSIVSPMLSFTDASHISKAHIKKMSKEYLLQNLST